MFLNRSKLRPGARKVFLSSRAIRLTHENTRLHAEIKELNHKVMTDDLTGCYNQKSFDQLAVNMFSQAIRYDDALAIAMFDLDGFKAINDKFGHAIGDQVLIAFSSSLQRLMRDGDIAARRGGDEFCAAFTFRRQPGESSIIIRKRTEFSTHGSCNTVSEKEALIEQQYRIRLHNDFLHLVDRIIGSVITETRLQLAKNWLDEEVCKTIGVSIAFCLWDGSLYHIVTSDMSDNEPGRDWHETETVVTFPNLASAQETFKSTLGHADLAMLAVKERGKDLRKSSR